MNLKLPLLYKQLLILALVFGPIVWLMFTDDGQRRTDTMVLWLFGENEIKMDLSELDSRLTEADLKQVYPDLDWDCQLRQTTYGDRICVSRLGVFNGIPVRYITVFFRTDGLAAMKLHYRRDNHVQLQNQTIQQLGQPEPGTAIAVTPAPSDEVLQWRTLSGAVIMKRSLLDADEPSMFWLSADLLNP